MKIYFVRHGEAMDDIRDEYGGWHDPELSPKGQDTAQDVAAKLKSQNIEVELVLTSPLLRAIQTAEPIAAALGVKLEKCVYLKERNTYGLLCGVNKTEAAEKYPELVSAYNDGKPVLGYEDYESFKTRMTALLDYLKRFNKNVVAVTHGKMLTAILTEVIGKKPSKLADGCLVEIDINGDETTLGETEGVEF